MPGIFKPNVGRMKEKRDIDGLAKALKHKDVAIRRGAAEALGHLRDARAVEPLIQALNDADTDVRRSAAQALEDMKDARAVEPLVQTLNDEDTDVRRNVAYALGHLGDRRAIEPLVQILKHSDKDDRRKAASALGEIKDAAAIEPLIEALKDEDSNVRWTAVQVLRRSGDPRALEALIQALKNRDVRLDAAYALKEMEVRRAVEPLIEALKDEGAVRQSPYGVQSIIGALARIGDLRAAEPIIDWLFVYRNELEFLSSDSCKYDRLAMPNIFGDYTDPILEASLLKRKRERMTIVDDGRHAASYIDRKEILDFEGSNEAFNKLCGIVTPISNNILHIISRKKDIPRNADERMRSLFTSQRKKAIEELERRGNPPYDPSIYLSKEAWKL